MNKQGGEEEEGTGNARVDKRSPALLAFFAFHPVLVERDEARVRLSRKLGKFAHDVLEYLIVVPATCLQRARDKQMHPREHSRLCMYSIDQLPRKKNRELSGVHAPCEFQRAWRYLLEQVPISLDTDTG